LNIADTHGVTIVGAGMAGTLLAILLARRGFEIDLFEKLPDPDSGERPIWLTSNLALGERARHALRMTGLLEKVDALSTPMRGRMIHDRSGRLTLQPYGLQAYERLYSVRRESLQQCLLYEAATEHRIRIHYGHKLKNVDWESSAAFFERGDAQRRHDFDVLIGADGPSSRVRRSLDRAFHIEVQEEMLDAGYKFLTIPPGVDHEPQMDPNALHVWPRGGYMLLAFPGPDGSFTATLFLPLHGDHRMIWGFAELDSWTRQKAFMEANFPDAAPLISRLEEEFRDHPVGLMGTVRCRHWHHGGQGLLIGDAAHAIVPFHGQGVNSALEDCTTLDEILATSPPDWETVFRELELRRIDDCNAIADMALDAYHTMRESVRHRDFLLRKALERELELRHPGRFIARYALVMFHRIPYTEAHERGRVQAEILDELLSGKQELTEVDLERAAQLVDERLTELDQPPAPESRN
jgi:kynurenine 3-monooxygenase